MSKPKVSVCIPCHNAGDYLEATLDSLLAQTYPAIEIIVTNDGSTDRSAEILDRYHQEYGVTVITQRLKSAAKSRNRALVEATGQYVKFFDADDLLSPEMIEKQVARLEGTTHCIASSEWGRFHNNDPGTYQANPEKVWRDIDGRAWLVEAFAEARPMMQAGMFLIPKTLLDEAGPWDEELTLVDDFEFYSRLFSRCDKILFTPETTLYYRSGLAGSLSQKSDRHGAESALLSYTRGVGHLLGKRSDADAKRSAATILQNFIYTYYPAHSDLLAQAATRVSELGGCSLEPDGPPRFQSVRKLLGWKLARRIELATLKFRHSS
ncbi:glycosyltransferase family 2 protein [Akkermansiaceae bacterium]|nr:glycosyltransferase family 2 protein [Akkermansiaceae bacterium]